MVIGVARRRATRMQTLLGFGRTSIRATLRKPIVLLGNHPIAKEKDNAAAGLRIGWAITADPHQLTATASHLIGGVGSRTQQAAVAALRQPLAPRQQALSDLSARTRAAAAHLDQIPGVSCPVPDAGFFLFPDLHGWLADTAWS